MLGLSLTLNGIYFFYRIPYNSLLMDSFPFPPKTAIIGMLGAAMGWNEETFISNIEKFSYGLIIERQGEKLQETATIFKEKNSPIYPITKNMYYKARYKVFLKAEDDLIERVYSALYDPAYVMTLGDSENLFYPQDKNYAKITHVDEGFTKNLKCILPKEIFIKNSDYKKISDSITPPAEYKMPVKFSGHGKKRHSIYKSVLAYSGIELIFNEDLPVYMFDGEPVYLF